MHICQTTTQLPWPYGVVSRSGPRPQQNPGHAGLAYSILPLRFAWFSRLNQFLPKIHSPLCSHYSTINYAPVERPILLVTIRSDCVWPIEADNDASLGVGDVGLHHSLHHWIWCFQHGDGHSVVTKLSPNRFLQQAIMSMASMGLHIRPRASCYYVLHS